MPKYIVTLRNVISTTIEVDADSRWFAESKVWETDAYRELPGSEWEIDEVKEAE